MLDMLLFAGIAAASAEAPAAPAAPSGEARTVIESQLASPPRSGVAAGISAEEADAIQARLIGMIGKTVGEERSPRIR
jgi:hypothetical protein